MWRCTPRRSAGAIDNAVFEIGMRMRAIERLGLAGDLRRALDAGKITATYRPIVRLDDRRVVGFDARPLWRHPARGRLAPEIFSAAAERHGLARALDEAVLWAAARQLAVWRESLAELPDGLFMGLAVTTAELLRDDLAASLALVTKKAGIAPRDVLLEVRPGAMTGDTERDLSRAVSDLRDAGFRTAAANFGVGSISLADLTRAPFDVLKLDASLTSGITLGGGRLEIVRGTLALASSLGMMVIVEGVETVEGETVLISLNAPFGQGGLYAHSLSAEGATAFLSERTSRGGAIDLMAGI